MRANPEQTTSARRPRRDGLRLLPSLSVLCLSLCLWLATTPALAVGTLGFFELSSGPGIPRSISSPASDVQLDIDYTPFTAEGGGFYGISELTIFATGDLTLTASGFACEMAQCLYVPSPFVGGTSITLTGTNDLVGEFGGLEDLVTIAVSGSKGYVVIAQGEYIDATGPGGTIGDIRSVPITILAQVPEPGFSALLAAGVALMAVHAHRRRRPALR